MRHGIEEHNTRTKVKNGTCHLRDKKRIPMTTWEGVMGGKGGRVQEIFSHEKQGPTAKITLPSKELFRIKGQCTRVPFSPQSHQHLLFC